MKKVILLLVLILCTTIGAKQSSETEKKEMLKQFMTFQEAVKNKNSKVLASMIDLSVEDNIALVLDSDGNFPKGTDYGTLLTEKLISANIGRVTENLQSLTYINIDPATLKVTNYFRDNASDEDKSRKYIYDDKEYSYYYKDKNNKKVYLPDARIWDERIDLSFEDEGFYILHNYTPNKLTPKEPEGDGGMAYEFSFKNGKLKLSAMYVND